MFLSWFFITVMLFCKKKKSLADMWGKFSVYNFLENLKNFLLKNTWSSHGKVTVVVFNPIPAIYLGLLKKKISRKWFGKFLLYHKVFMSEWKTLKILSSETLCRISKLFETHGQFWRQISTLTCSILSYSKEKSNKYLR